MSSLPHKKVMSSPTRDVCMDPFAAPMALGPCKMVQPMGVPLESSGKGLSNELYLVFHPHRWPEIHAEEHGDPARAGNRPRRPTLQKYVAYFVTLTSRKN